MKKISKKSFSALILVFAMITGLVIQSCQVESVPFIEPEKEIALDNFKNTLKNSSQKLEIVITKINKLEISDKNSKEAKKFDEKEAFDILKPLVEQTNQMFAEFGLSPDLMKDFFGSSDDPRIALVGLGFLARAEKKRNNLAMSNNLTLRSLMTISTANAEEGDWLDCLAGAVGADLFVAVGDALFSAVWNAGSTAAAGTITSETLLAFGITGVKKVLTKFIGPVGLLVAAYDFSSCMDWI